MDAQTLRAQQAPFKQQYREHPETALVTHSVEGQLGGDLTIDIKTKYGTITAGPHPATGGSGRDICSGDILLEALVGCAGVTLNSVATAMEIPLRSARIKAEGDIDYRGTLGVSKDVPVGFKNIRLKFTFDTDAPQEKVEKLVSLTERYCIVLQTLKNSVEVSSTVSRA
ncbi:MAG TPA: OsmC family protein [Candidatus Kapabacteria bacterium]|nr:OsmC family protein [Candidatus Kapabacteria bacterium]